MILFINISRHKFLINILLSVSIIRVLMSVCFQIICVLFTRNFRLKKIPIVSTLSFKYVQICSSQDEAGPYKLLFLLEVYITCLLQKRKTFFVLFLNGCLTVPCHHLMRSLNRQIMYA